MKKRVLLTQSQGRLEGLVEKLIACDFEVVHQPLIQTTVMPDVLEDAKTLLRCEWMLFTSQAAIDAWVDLGLSLGLEFPTKIRFGAVGHKTAKRLEALGVEVDVIGEPQDAEGLAEVFIRNYPDAKSVALPKGKLSLSILEDRLNAAGIDTKAVVIYETNSVDVTHLDKETFDVVFFASPSAVEAFHALSLDNLSLAKELAYVAIGETTAKAIYQTGQDCIIAQTPTVDAIAEAIVKAIENKT